MQDLEDRGFAAPGRVALERAAVKLDAVMMGATRDRNRDFGVDDVTRYLMPDGSPQGRELFLMKLFEVFHENYALSRKTICPGTSLAHHKSGTMDKAMCIIHVAFLSVGPNADSMRAWGDTFAAIAHDLGEVTVPQIPDLTDV